MTVTGYRYLLPLPAIDTTQTCWGAHEHGVRACGGIRATCRGAHRSGDGEARPSFCLQAGAVLDQDANSRGSALLRGHEQRGAAVLRRLRHESERRCPLWQAIYSGEHEQRRAAVLKGHAGTEARAVPYQQPAKRRQVRATGWNTRPVHLLQVPSGTCMFQSACLRRTCWLRIRLGLLTVKVGRVRRGLGFFSTSEGV